MASLKRSTRSPRARGSLSRLPRPHLAREASRSGDLHRQALGHAPQDGGKGGCRGRGVFRDEIKPLLDDPLIEFIGEIGDGEKSAFLGNAVALLFPIDWPEPFGLVLIEAMACGTPVIAWRCGSVAEIVEDGKTGFIVDSEDEAVRAVGQLDKLDRRVVRRVFQERFTADVMARNYLRLYWRLCGAVATADVSDHQAAFGARQEARP